jgi:hypothetical protein
MLISPALVLSAVIASLYAAVFLLIWGQRTRKKWLYWVVAVAAFGVGQLLAKLSSVHPLMIGNMHLLAGTLVSWAALFVAKWFRL